MAFDLKNKFEKELEIETISVKLIREIQWGGYDIVSTEELNQWLDSKQGIIIVDAMPFEESYKKQHVPGAAQFLFPISEMKQWDSKETVDKFQEDFIALLGNDKNKTIIVYCGFVIMCAQPQRCCMGHQIRLSNKLPLFRRNFRLERVKISN